MDVWSHDRADRLERLKRLEGMKEKNKATGEFGRLGEISVSPLTKLIMDIPNLICTTSPGSLRGLLWYFIEKKN